MNARPDVSSPLGPLPDGSAVARLMHGHDWNTCSLGAPGAWPSALRTLVRLMLHAKTPVFLAWGPELCLFYNDAYVEVLGIKHPRALGRPFREVWAEVWPDVAPLVERTLAGEALHMENVPFTIRRKGIDEQTWFTFSYTPLHGDDGAIAGLYCPLFETTEKVLAQRSREEEMTQLQRLFEQAPSFMAVVHGPDHVYALSNHANARLVGHRPLMGRTVREAFPELEGQGYFELLDRVYQSGEPFIGRRMPATFQKAAGAPPEQRFVDFIFQPILDANGRSSGIFIEGYDVTEQKLAEDALRLSEQRALASAELAETEGRRLQAVLEAVPVAIIVADAGGRLVRMNSANRALWGDHPLSTGVDGYAEWKGWWADGSARHGQRLQPRDWAMARALCGEASPRDIIEIEPFGRPGVRRTIINHGAAVRDARGEIIGAVVAQLDITDSARLQAALRDSEAKFRTIADAMPQMVWSTRADGHHDYYNQRWYEYTGAREGATDGTAWNDMFHPDDRERARERWQHSLESGEPYEVEYRLRHHSGQYRWTLGRALPVRDDKGGIIRWMGTCTDIHEQKLIQDALRESDRRKDEFLAMLAHELRNPLAPISSAAELLARIGHDPARIAQIGGIISRQARHMTGLIEDLLDVSRVTRGLVSLNRVEVDIKPAIAEAMEQVRPLLEARGHRLETHLDSAHALVLGDRKRLVQVIANILTNAAKYTPNGGHIVLRLDTDEDEVTIAVRDNGIGMSAGLLERAFDLFTQGERSADRTQGGLGIGLALVQSLVRLHGGTITAHSAGEGRGSEFVVRLPRHAAQDRERQPAARGIAPADAGTALRILVVDDNIDAAQLLAMVLEQAGHAVQVEHQSMQALQRARQFLPQVCLLDIGLPDIDGTELLQRLRRLPGMDAACFIAITGYGQPQDRAAALAAGFHRHLVKPVDTGELLALLADLPATRAAASAARTSPAP